MVAFVQFTLASVLVPNPVPVIVPTIPLAGLNQNGPVITVLETENGNVGIQYRNDYSTLAIESFKISGDIQRIAPNYSPQIATIDGGVIAVGDLGQRAYFDALANMTAQMVALL